MADLFGAWIPDSWIEEIFDACRKTPWHTYMFLTKNAERYISLHTWGKLLTGDNIWYGTTCTDGGSDLFYSEHHNTFLSIEPLLADLGRESVIGEVDIQWVILGAESGNRKGKVVPEKAWIDNIVEACTEANVPLFMKDNIKPYFDGDLIRQMPKRLRKG